MTNDKKAALSFNNFERVMAGNKILFMALMALVSAQGAMLDLQPQIDAAAARGGGVVRVEPGEHETKPFELKWS